MTEDRGRPVPPHGSGPAQLPPVHAPGGLGLTFCGRIINSRLNYSGDPDDVTCTPCRKAMGLPALSTSEGEG